jgi:hypothetical protein
MLAITSKGSLPPSYIMLDVPCGSWHIRETAKRLVEKGALEIPSSGVFSRADAQLLTIFDVEMI